MPFEIVGREWLLDHLELELIEGGEVVKVGPGVGAVGVNGQRHPFPDPLPDRPDDVEVGAGLDLELDPLVSPADGTLSQIGTIHGQALLQAKGHDFDLLALLAGDKQKTAQFSDGLFATIYLSPKDYHRVHIPFAGTLESMVFVPGDLFSVSEATTQLIPGLFARNERVICHFDTAIGPMAVILVGAIFVGSMETVWHGEVRAARGQPTKWSIKARIAATSMPARRSGVSTWAPR